MCSSDLLYRFCLVLYAKDVAFPNLVLTRTIPLTLSVQYACATCITHRVGATCALTHSTNHSSSFFGSVGVGSGVTGPSDVLIVPYGVGIILSPLAIVLVSRLPTSD